MSNYYINSLRYGLSFYKDAVSRYRVHSPYFYQLINDVLSRKNHYSFPAVELLRKKLLKNETIISMIDFGAGSRLDNNKNKKISEIASVSLSPTQQCQTMFWTINRLQPKTVIELGSSLGISTLYLALANSQTKILSFEGNPDSIYIAKQQAELMNLQNIEFIEGSFDMTLPPVIKALDTLDMAFIDGNHQYEATIAYFHMFLPKIHEKSVLIFDDIYWSPGMKKAWEEIKNHPEVKASLDLYTYGMVFFDPSFKVKKHIKLLPLWYKPWQLLNF